MREKKELVYDRHEWKRFVNEDCVLGQPSGSTSQINMSGHCVRIGICRSNAQAQDLRRTGLCQVGQQSSRWTLDRRVMPHLMSL